MKTLRRPGTIEINTLIVASMDEGITLPQVFRGVMPFLLCFLVCTALLLAWPRMTL